MFNLFYLSLNNIYLHKGNAMNIFRRKSPLQVLEKKYKKLLEESNKLSKIDRAKSDLKYAEAHEIGIQIDELIKENQTNK